MGSVLLIIFSLCVILAIKTSPGDSYQSDPQKSDKDFWGSHHFDTPSPLIIFLASRHTGGHTQCGGDSGENAHKELNHHLPSLFVLHSHKGFSVLHLVL